MIQNLIVYRRPPPSVMHFENNETVSYLDMSPSARCLSLPRRPPLAPPPRDVVPSAARAPSFRSPRPSLGCTRKTTHILFRDLARRRLEGKAKLREIFPGPTRAIGPTKQRDVFRPPDKTPQRVFVCVKQATVHFSFDTTNVLFVNVCGNTSPTNDFGFQQMALEYSSCSKCL